MSNTVQRIERWSYSRLTDFEKCAFMAKLKIIDRIPEPVRPLPPGKTEHANDRGTRIHTAAEFFVKGDGPFIPELAKFKTEFAALQRLHAQGKVSLEGEWGYTRDWAPCDWKAAWARVKLDAMVFLSKQEAVVIDYKSGRKFGNEIKHAEQTALYQLAAFLRYPELQLVHTELWYLDVDELTHSVYTRRQGLRFMKNFDQRGDKMTRATTFPANPNKFSCQWCPYHPVKGSGHCTKGV